MTFEEQLDLILRHEGKYQKWREDRGNWLNGKLIGTRYGITAPRLAQHRGVSTLTQHDMRTLPLDEAKAIYRKWYYDAARIGLLPNQIEAKTFDMAVNHGTRWGVKLMQRAIREFEPDIDVDGIIGPQTVRLAYAAVQEHGPRAIVNAAVDVRNRYYAAIIRGRPSQAKFRRGWLRRSNSFADSAPLIYVADAGAPTMRQPRLPAGETMPGEGKPIITVDNKKDDYVTSTGAIAQIGRAIFGWITAFGRKSRSA